MSSEALPTLSVCWPCATLGGLAASGRETDTAPPAWGAKSAVRCCLDPAVPYRTVPRPLRRVALRLVIGSRPPNVTSVLLALWSGGTVPYHRDILYPTSLQMQTRQTSLNTPTTSLFLSLSVSSTLSRHNNLQRLSRVSRTLHGDLRSLHARWDMAFFYLPCPYRNFIPNRSLVRSPCPHGRSVLCSSNQC